MKFGLFLGGVNKYTPSANADPERFGHASAFEGSRYAFYNGINPDPTKGCSELVSEVTPTLRPYTWNLRSVIAGGYSSFTQVGSFQNSSYNGGCAWGNPGTKFGVAPGFCI